MEGTHNQLALLRSLSCLLLAAGALTFGCYEEGEEVPPAPRDESPFRSEYPPTARPDTVAHFRADIEAVRHPSDGGGSVELVLTDDDDGSVTASGLRR